ncbi:TIGR03545 family protein [Treponema sp.]|uniref:TIGR03545 family protein n=1 Tax=Treponema sp. TaxID=166 RepID=UPI003F046284
MKKEKKEKVVSAKKLPGIFKKKYPARKLEKKVYKHIFIPSDLELVKSLFEPEPQKEGFFFVPREKEIPAKQLKKLKAIAKEIRKQKPAFKLVPFAATAGILTFSVLLVISTKNIIAKKIITGTMQGIFGAKTDIDSLNVEFLGASITIKNLQQANKNSPMKNLFQAEKIEINFNLTEALRGKFDAENIELSGLSLNTERKISGELPKQKKQQKKDQAASADFSKKKEEAIAAAKNSIQQIFADYNPQNIIEGFEQNLKSPAAAQQTKEEVENLVAKWKEKPEELETQIKEFDKSLKSVLDTDWGNIDNIEKLRQALETVNTSIEKSKTLTNSIKTTSAEVKSDSKKIEAVSQQIKSAVESDQELVKKQLDKITSFKIPDGEKILGNMIDSFFYSAAGEYYPYIKQASDFAMQAKANSSKTSKAEKKSKQKKTGVFRQRQKGTDIYWKKDRVPSFLIERIYFSGIGISAEGQDITNDMDKRECPAVLTGSYENKKQLHKANLTVDSRTETENPLVSAEYSGNNFSAAFSAPYLKLKSNADVAAQGTISDDGKVCISAKFNLQSISLSSEDFEPEFASRLYKTALSNIKDISMGATAVFNGEEKFSIDIDSDIDKKFIKALKKTADAEITGIVTEAKKEIMKILQEKTGGVTEKINEFSSIKNRIDTQSADMDRLNSLLEKKKAELQKQIEQKTKSAAEKALKDAGVSIPKNEKLEEAIEKGTNSLKGLFNGKH